MANAWDWTQNAHNSLCVFQLKIARVLAIQNSQKNLHSGLLDLTQSQIENMALGEYGGGGRAAKQQYCFPTLTNGQWQWQLNTSPKATNAENYVNAVRGTMPSC
jgi:hypothetical protein